LHGAFAGAAVVVPPVPRNDATTTAISTAGISAVASRRGLSNLS